MGTCPAPALIRETKCMHAWYSGMLLLLMYQTCTHAQDQIGDQATKDSHSLYYSKETHLRLAIDIDRLITGQSCQEPTAQCFCPG